MRRRGFTMTEVLFALLVLSLLTALVAVALAGTLRQTSAAANRTQAVRLLSDASRRLVAGDYAVLPTPAGGGRRSWDYGELAGVFPDLSGEGGRAEPDAYRLTITSTGQLNLSGSTLTRYRLEVCWREGGAGEQCVDAETIGPDPAAAGSTPPLPGLN